MSFKGATETNVFANIALYLVGHSVIVQCSKKGNNSLGNNEKEGASVLQNMFNKNMLVVPSTICTSLRKCQPTLLAQVVSCRDVSVKQEQGINVEASRLCVTSGQSG